MAAQTSEALAGIDKSSTSLACGLEYDAESRCVLRRAGKWWREAEKKTRGSQVIVYGSLGSLLTPRFVECISFWLRNRWGISSGMVQRQDTSVAPSLRATCGRVLCLCLRAVSATTGLCFCCIVRGPG
jgi:hypothetical protein